MKHDCHSHISRKSRFWLIGLAALLWVALRSGLNPKRLSYPCQRAAMPLAAAWLASLAAFIGGSYALRRWTRISGTVLLMGGVVWFVATLPVPSGASPQAGNPLPYWEVATPVSNVFVLDSMPPTSGSLAAGDASVPDAWLSDPAIDSLLLISASHDLHLHKTPSHPDGIVGADNVVVIKGNFQWYGKVSTNTDRIKGLIRQILNHPAGFTGEILVCDNTMNYAIDQNDNNSEDPAQSIVSVVNTFHAKGYPVYVLDWKYIYSTLGTEYSKGDYNDAYMYDTTTKVSYPKFRSPSGRHLISLRYGIWDSVGASYDSTRLCLINFCVLKHHGMAGATVAVKNWIGVMTTAYSADRYGSWNAMHYTYLFTPYALVARIMDVTYPRLSIVDATWTSYAGNTTPDNVVNTNVILASTDPVAVSWYAAKFVLTPISNPNDTDPDLPGSKYHNSLSNWWRFLSDSAGRACTMDSTRISVYGRKSILPASRPAIPAPYAPPHGAVNQPCDPVLVWNAAGGAESYHVQLSADSTFATLFIDEEGHADTMLNVTGLPYGSTYYWRVRSHNTVGESDWSEERRFRTVYPLNIDVRKDWNMLSLSALLADRRASSVFPGAVSSAYEYLPGAGYRKRDTLTAGNGYWLKFNAPDIFSYEADAITQETIAVKAGWNMIGVPGKLIDVSTVEYDPPSMGHSPYFGYHGNYFITDTLKPCGGYWINVSIDGKLIVGAMGHAAPVMNVRNPIADLFIELNFESEWGNSSTLRLAKGTRDGAVEDFMPPVPPENGFDVRFLSGRNTELESTGGDAIHTIRIQSPEYPLSVAWKIHDAGHMYMLECGGERIVMSGSGSARISVSGNSAEGSVVLATIRNASLGETPGEFALEQNYPNPFNPATVFRYHLPVESDVRLEVYDVNGSLIASLLHERQRAGVQEVKWYGADAEGVQIASGVYFARLEAAEAGSSSPPFIQVRKIVLLK
jgi:hypothetical protein